MAVLTQPVSKPSGALRVRALTTREQFEALRPFWEHSNGQPNCQLDFFQLVNETPGCEALPHVLVVERDAGPQALVIGRVARQQFRCRLGYASVPLGSVNQLTFTHGGVLGEIDHDAAGAVVSELVKELKTGAVDLVLFNHLQTTSPLFSLLRSAPGPLSRDYLVTPQLHWKTRLPQTQAEFLQRLNKKHRYWVRRLEKLLETDFPGHVAFRAFSGAQGLDEVMGQVESVASKTYQRQIGAGFRNDAEQARRLRFEADRGWLRIYLLYLRGAPAAFWIGRVYRNQFFSDATGYDPALRAYELGTIVFMRMVGELCREGVEAIDFGLGDALYKQRFGDESWSEAVVRIFSPRFRGLSLNATQTSLEAPARCLQSALRRFSLQQRLKTAWRRLLVRKNQA